MPRKSLMFQMIPSFILMFVIISITVLPAWSDETSTSKDLQKSDSKFVVKPVVEEKSSTKKFSGRTHCPPVRLSKELKKYMNDLSSAASIEWKKSKYSKKAKTNTKIGFGVLKSGEFKDVKVVYTSGNKRQDRRALQIVKKMKRFRELPKKAPDSVEAQLSFGRVGEESSK